MKPPPSKPNLEQEDARKKREASIAWTNYWNGWNDCADAGLGWPLWKRILNVRPPDGGRNKPADPEKG